jgi:flagellar biosynthesis anti-sigma factor FlgM
MKIHSNAEIAAQVNRSRSAETKRPEGNTSTVKPADEGSGEGAIVEFSQRSKDVQQVYEILQSQPDVRAEKIRAIKERIEKEVYEIDFEGTADNMLKSFF